MKYFYVLILTLIVAYFVAGYETARHTTPVINYCPAKPVVNYCPAR